MLSALNPVLDELFTILIGGPLARMPHAIAWVALVEAAWMLTLCGKNAKSNTGVTHMFTYYLAGFVSCTFVAFVLFRGTKSVGQNQAVFVIAAVIAVVCMFVTFNGLHRDSWTRAALGLTGFVLNAGIMAAGLVNLFSTATAWQNLESGILWVLPDLVLVILGAAIVDAKNGGRFKLPSFNLRRRSGGFPG